jgi:hypothetical protein
LSFEAATSRAPQPPAAFYCVADSRYFLGAAAMLNSLRVLGHAEPVFVLDCGLTDRQRELLAPHASLVPAPSDAPPWLLKTVAPLRHPAEVMVLIDADIIATRPLGELIAEAASPRVVAVENDTQRFVPEWGRLLGLGEVRRQPYVSSGLVFMGQPLGEDVLALLDALVKRVDVDSTYRAGSDPRYPFFYPEQDVLNAILASRIERERLRALPNRLAPNPPFRGLRLVDEKALCCAHRDGTEPYALHHFAPKPWLERTHHGIYSRLLRRLLTASDVPLAVREEELPPLLRSGLRAWVARKRVNVPETLTWRVREPLAARWRARDG